MGIADRSAYDLTCHSAATKTKLTAEAALDEPITVVSYEVSKESNPDPDPNPNPNPYLHPNLTLTLTLS